MERGLVRVEEAAQYLGLGRSKTYELIAIGELPVVRIGRATRIPMEALRDYVSRRLAEAQASGPFGRRA
jgi:excisionase family DNA binding protein